MSGLQILTAGSWAGAVLSLAAYVYAFILRPNGDRLISTMGLFFTAVALTQMPTVLANSDLKLDFMNALYAVVAILAAATAQAIAAVRTRREPRKGTEE